MKYILNEIVVFKGIPTRVTENSCIECIFHWTSCVKSLDRRACYTKIYDHVYTYCFQDVFKI